MTEILLAKRSDGLLEPVDAISMEEVSKWSSAEYILVTPKKASRSLLMNRCLHKYCEIIAEKLNDAGYDMLKVIKPGFCIPWSKHTVKELLWRPIQNALADKNSTTEATNQDLKDVHRALDAHLSDKFGVSASWPNRYGD